MIYDLELREQWDDDLSGLVARGDCREVRAFFDRAFWADRKEPPTWDHLKIALQGENKPMLKLLVTWGARATDEEMARLRAFSKDKYPHYLKLLRQAGLPLSAAVLKETPVAEMQPPPEPLIPQEWKRVLQAFQQNGAKEAFIGGAALCDLFNERGACRKVDIFLNSPYSQEMNKKILKSAFGATGFDIAEQLVKHFPDTGAPQAFPPPQTAKLPRREDDYRQPLTQTWTVVAGPQRTRYNIVFIDRGVFAGSVLASTPGKFIERALNDLDFGLNQIAYDGQQIITTPSYDADVKNKQVTLKNLGDTSKEQLQRLVKKYPDWKLCPESKKLLVPPIPYSRWADHHGFIG